MQARLDRRKVKLLTRHALDWTDKFKPIADALAGLPAEQALIDGEIVSEDENGDRQLFAAAAGPQGRPLRPHEILCLRPASPRRCAISRRRRCSNARPRLQRLMASLPWGMPLRFSEHFTEQGSLLLEHACRMSLEGILSKRATAPYRSGRGRRLDQDQVLAPAGIRRRRLCALHGRSQGDRRADPGLLRRRPPAALCRARRHRLFPPGCPRALATAAAAAHRPSRRSAASRRKRREARNAKWVEPRLVVEVAFHGWTHGDRVRQASFQGIREDKIAHRGGAGGQADGSTHAAQTHLSAAGACRPGPASSRDKTCGEPMPMTCR